MLSKSLNKSKFYWVSVHLVDIVLNFNQRKMWKYFQFDREGWERLRVERGYSQSHHIQTMLAKIMVSCWKLLGNNFQGEKWKIQSTPLRLATLAGSSTWRSSEWFPFCRSICSDNLLNIRSEIGLAMTVEVSGRDTGKGERLCWDISIKYADALFLF